MEGISPPVETNSYNESEMTTGIADVFNSPQIKSVEHLVATSTILGLMILCTIIGNVFVIAAIILEKNLHNVANYLILSLAVADLMVAAIVMPISAVNEISKVWFFRSEICDMWVSLDVLSCTASILHLVAISIDRYWAVTNIDYIRNRTAKRIVIMIACVWFMAMSISIPPLFGWKDGNDPTKTGVCTISQNHGYTLFSTIGAFYFPTILMFIIYAKIFIVARQRIRKKRFAEKNLQMNKIDKTNTHIVAEMTLLNVPHELPISQSDNSQIPCNGSRSTGSGDHDDNENKCNTNGHVSKDNPALFPGSNLEILKAKRQKEKLEMKRERKAARTLAIITGAFIICWLPFFIIAILVPFIPKSDGVSKVHPLVQSIVLWLGYCNSLLNPIIYTVFNPEFRAAFQKILFGKYSRKYRQNNI